MLRHSTRAFVEQLDFTTSVGDNVRVVVTDLGILEPRDGELTLTRGASRRRRRTTSSRRPAGSCASPTTCARRAPPTAEELDALRALETRGSSAWQ